MERKIIFHIFLGIFFCFLLNGKCHDVPKIVLIREESNGTMNVLYCDIQIEKEEEGMYKKYTEYDISGFEILDKPYQYDKNELSLAGGEKLVLNMQPGQYRIKCFTPPSRQNDYLNKDCIWESDFIYLDLKYSDIPSVVINPMVDDTGYTGNWKLSLKEKK